MTNGEEYYTKRYISLPDGKRIDMKKSWNIRMKKKSSNRFPFTNIFRSIDAGYIDSMILGYLYNTKDGTLTRHVWTQDSAGSIIEQSLTKEDCLQDCIYIPSLSLNREEYLRAVAHDVACLLLDVDPLKELDTIKKAVELYDCDYEMTYEQTQAIIKARYKGTGRGTPEPNAAPYRRTQHRHFGSRKPQ